MNEEPVGEVDPRGGTGGSLGDASRTSGLGGRVRRAAWRVLVRGGAGLALLVGLLWIAASMGAGMRWAVPFAVERVLPAGWSAEIGAVQGSWLDRIEVAGATLEGPGLSISVERLLIRYRVRPLLSERVDVRELLVERPTVRMEVPDSTARPREAVPADTASGGMTLASLLAGEPAAGWAVRIATFAVRDGHAEIAAGDGGRYTLSGLRITGHGALDAAGLSAAVDTLDADFVSVLRTPGDSAFRSEGRVAMAGDLAGGLLRLDTLSVASDRSRVSAGGELAFVARAELLRRIDARLTARPLDMRDLPIRLPDPIGRAPDVSLDLVARGSRDSVVFSLQGSGFGGATTADADAVLRPRATGRDGTAPALDGSVTFTGFDLTGWSGPPFDGRAAGTVAVTLQRLGPGSGYRATGSVSHEPPVVDGSRLVARPLRADFDVSGNAPGDSVEAPGTPFRSDARADLVVGGVSTAPAAAGTSGGGSDAWRPLGRITAEIDGSAARWGVALDLDSGRVEATGTADWGGPAFAGTVERLRAQRLDLVAVDTVYPATDLSGELTGRLQGSSLETLRGSASLVVGPSEVAGTTVDSLAVTSEIRGRTVEGTLMGRAAPDEVETRYTVEVLDSLVRFDAVGLRYVRRGVTGSDEPGTPREPGAEGAPGTAALDATGEPVDRANDVTAGQDPGPAAELYGRASGTWALADVRRGSLSATLDSARWSTASFRDARITAEVDGERIMADAELQATDVMPTPIRVRGRLDLTGAALTELDGVATVTVDRAHEGAPEVVDSVSVRVDATGDGRFDLDGTVRPGEGGAVGIGGTAWAFADSLRFDVEAAGGLGEAVALLGGASVDSLLVRASGHRIAGVWRGMSGDVAVSGARWSRDPTAGDSLGLTVRELRAAVRYDSTGLRLDTLDVRSNVLEARGAGRLPADGSGGRIDVTAELLELNPLRSLVGLDVFEAGEGSIAVTAEGALDSLRWTGDLDVEAVVVDRLRMTGLRLQGQGVVAPPHDVLGGLRSTEVDLTLDRIVLPESEVRRVSVNAAGGADSVRVQAGAEVDDRRNASLLIHVDPRPDRKTARIEDVRFQLDDDQWALVDQAMLRYGDGVSLEEVLLRAGGQEIRLEGGVSAEGALDMNARMDSTDVGTVADLLGFPRLRGWLTGRVRVQGTTETPEAWVDMTGAFHRADRPPAPVEVTVRANGRRVRGSVDLVDPSGGRLRVGGGALLPGARADAMAAAGMSGAQASADSTIFGFASDSIDVTVEADRFGLRWTEAFFTADALASIAGSLDGSLTLEGSSARPTLAGELRLVDGSARPTGLGVRWDSLSAVVRGDGASLVVDPARIAGSSGDARVTGTVGVVGSMPLDLTLTMDGFQAIRSDAYGAVVSGTLDVGGGVTAPEVAGNVRVEALDIFLDERVTSGGLEPVELTEEDLQVLRDRFGIVPELEPSRRPIAERLTVDVEVELGRDSWLRKRTSPEMAVPFSGTVDVQMRPGQEPVLEGSVEVIAGRGFVEQFGRRFALSSGTVTFSGPPSATRVDLEARYTIPSRDNPDEAEVTIILEVNGTQDDLGLTLSSDPPLENADIVSYIATGRPAAGSLAFQGQESQNGLVAAGAGLALSQMTGLIESAAARSVGLDVVEIRREGLRQATVVAGKYLSPRLYVGFAKPISLQEGGGLSFGGEDQYELEIEYEALRWLILNVEGSGSAVRFFLRGRRAY